MACLGCGLRYLDPQPTEQQLEALYGPSYFAQARPGEPGYDRYVEEFEGIRRTFDERLGMLPAPTPAGSRLLDVGAALGLFVERARAAGWQAVGLEPSPWAADYARDVLRQPVRTGKLPDVGVPEESCDVVTLWEVLEHLPDPRDTLSSIRRVLTPGGVLALSTPDAGSAVARLLGSRWPGWTKIPEHLYFFDRATLRRLLMETGFVVESMRYVSLVVSRRYLLDRIGRITGLPFHRHLPPAWLERPVRVNPLYDLMVLARRPA
jgi:2-polyprenyl-3-methyl-5-hydroxy-6-metoxy-1,4-benzoquinol methylase